MLDVQGSAHVLVLDMESEKKKFVFDWFHYLLLFLLFMTAIPTILVDLFVDEPTTEELIQQGRDLEIMQTYTPCELLDAVDNGNYNYDELSDTIKDLLAVVDDC